MFTVKYKLKFIKQYDIISQETSEEYSFISAKNKWANGLH